MGNWLSEKHLKEGIQHNWVGPHTVDLASNAVCGVDNLKVVAEGTTSHEIIAGRCDVHNIRNSVQFTTKLRSAVKMFDPMDPFFLNGQLFFFFFDECLLVNLERFICKPVNFIGNQNV